MAPRRRASAQRSAAEWIGRCLLAAIALAAGYVGVIQSLAYSLRSSDSQRAHALAPWDGRITAQWARKLADADASAADRSRADRLARMALRQDPTTAVAAATLGINTQLRGDTKGARRLLAYAQALTRRDLQTQIWAIEDAVARDDVAGALEHYDIALRTSRRAPDILFPILANAIADPIIRLGLIERLAAGASWSEAFVNHVGGRGPDPQATAMLFMGLRRAGVPVSEGASAETLNLLISKSLYEEAWSYYASIRRGAVRHMSRDPRFDAGLVSPSVFDWMLTSDTAITASVQRGDKGGVFDFAAPPGIGGPLLQQTQMLPPGNYRLAGRSEGIDQPEASRPYWALGCRDGRELGRFVIPNSAQANGVFAGEFIVPAECPVQILALVARPSDMVSGVTGRIREVRLFPARLIR